MGVLEENSGAEMFKSCPVLALKQIYERSGMNAARQFSSSKLVVNRSFSSDFGGVRVSDGTESIEDVRKDLGGLLREEIDEKTGKGVMEDHSNEFEDSSMAKIEEDNDEFKISWVVEPYLVEVLYAKPSGLIEVDEEGLGMDLVHELDEGQLHELEKQEEAMLAGKRAANGVVVNEAELEEDEDDRLVIDEEDFEDEDEEDEDDEENKVTFEVKLSAEGKKPVDLWCMAGLDNRLYVEQIYLEDAPPLNFNSLSEGVQDRMYDFLDSIKLDDRFGFYMRRRFYKAKRVGAKRTLKALAELVELEEVKGKNKKKGKK